MDASSYLQFVAALVFVLALIGLAALLARRIGLGGTARATGGRRRLAVVEVLPLDGRRRLVLLRCDDREHLVILGPGGETVVDGPWPDGEAFRRCLSRAVATPEATLEPRP